MGDKKRIVVLCGGKFALGALQKLALEQFLCGIGIGKGQDAVVQSIENAANASQLPFRHFPDKQSMSELNGWLREIAPDYVFSIAFPFRIPIEVLEYGEKKFINLHLGPLPHYRGAMPLFEVLRYQEKQTAIAAHYMNADFDEGDLIFNDYIPVSPTDTYGLLATKLSNKATQVAFNLANMLEYATVIPSSPQNENEARYFEFPEEQDSFVNWKNMTAEEIVALINACNPWNNGADCILNGNIHIKLLEAQVLEENHMTIPGTVISYNHNGKIKVACIGNKCILISLVHCDWGILTAERYINFLEMG